MRQHREAAGSVFGLQSKDLVLEYAYCQMIPEEVFSTLLFILWVIFRTSIQYQPLYTPLPRITKHPLIEGWGWGLVSGEQRLCFQLNGLPGYMLFTCITVIYCDNSTTPTDNTALLRIRGITEGNSEGGDWTSVGNTVRRMIPHTVGKWQSAGGANFPMTAYWWRGRGFWMRFLVIGYEDAGLDLE